MKSIGVHTYGSGGGGSNFASPISPDVLNLFANVLGDEMPKILYRKNGINYVQVSLPPTMIYPRSLLGPDLVPQTQQRLALPESKGDDNCDGLFWEEPPQV